MYRVTEQRITEVSIDIDAESEEDAMERFIADGEEVHRHTFRREVTNIEQIN